MVYLRSSDYFKSKGLFATKPIPGDNLRPGRERVAEESLEKSLSQIRGWDSKLNEEPRIHRWSLCPLYPRMELINANETPFPTCANLANFFSSPGNSVFLRIAPFVLAKGPRRRRRV